MRLFFIIFLLVVQILKQITSYFTGTLWGALLLSLSIYYGASHFCIDVLSFEEIIFMPSTLNPETQAMLAASLISVVGFFMAFHTSAKLWAEQKKHSIGFDIAESLGAHSKVISQESIFICSYLTVICDLIEDVNSGVEIGPERTSYLFFQAERFQDAKSKIIREVDELSSLRMINNFFLQTKKGVDRILEAMIDDLNNRKIDISVPLPFNPKNHCDIHWIKEFSDTFDYEKAALSAKKISHTTASSVGMIKGALYSPIVMPGFGAYWDMLKDTKGFISFLISESDRMKKNKT